MKSYNDLFADSGIITAMKTVDADKYDEIFGKDYDNELLDDYICFSNGNYICTSETENLFIKDNAKKRIAQMIWLKFYSSWKALLKTLSAEYNETYSDTETTERNKDTTSNIDETDTQNNKVFAYDSETASNDTMSDNVRNTDGKGNESETITYKKNGFDYGANLFDIIEKYRNYQIENVFCDVVKSNIIGFLCYNIY